MAVTDALLNRLSSDQKARMKQFAGWVPPSLRQPRAYRRWRRFLVEAQRWPAARIEAWQLEQLRDLIRHAIANCEGYRDLYRRAGIRAKDIRSKADLRSVPFTTKEMFQNDIAAFTIAGGGRYTTTGGSTGIPFGFFEARQTAEIEAAFMHTGWAWMGWRLDQRSAVLRGSFVGTAEDFRTYDSFARQLALSSYYLTPGSVTAYLDSIREYGIRVLQAYPSTLNLLCDLIQEKGLQGRLDLDLILLGSENVYDWQLEKFGRTFPQTRVFSWYGHCEKAILAPWCEQTRLFHAWPFYGLTEIVDPDERETDEGVEGEIVGTSFHQRITPFIRYRTMDRAVKGPPSCVQCGRQFQILSRIAGRSHEVIVTRTGRFISMTAINMHDNVFDGLRQFQFRQEEPGELVFNYVPKGGQLSASEIEKIRRSLLFKFGEDVKVALQPVSEIPRTKAGKFRFLDQRLPIRYGDR
ncbi:phenylacetate--CoA ligase family protein [Myxococcota bacterium]|nr:phenylacetate--CoA ligase family protein [Myxococcota bacterium]